MIVLREVEVYRPYASEVPEDMLLAAGLDESTLDEWLDAEVFRVAKRGAQVLGAYAMNRRDREVFDLLGVVVDARFRRQGLGRWLVGHAVGVAESKGGRRVAARARGRGRMLARIGFEQRAEGLIFDLVQE